MDVSSVASSLYIGMPGWRSTSLGEKKPENHKSMEPGSNDSTRSGLHQFAPFVPKKRAALCNMYKARSPSILILYIIKLAVDGPVPHSRGWASAAIADLQTRLPGNGFHVCWGRLGLWRLGSQDSPSGVYY